jgi:hypothetical protein
MSFEESIESELVRPDGSSLAVRINSTQLTACKRPLVLRLCQELTR